MKQFIVHSEAGGAPESVNIPKYYADGFNTGICYFTKISIDYGKRGESI